MIKNTRRKIRLQKQISHGSTLLRHERNELHLRKHKTAKWTKGCKWSRVKNKKPVGSKVQLVEPKGLASIYQVKNTHNKGDWVKIQC